MVRIDYEKLKKEVEEIRKKSIINLPNGEPLKYHITYDTFGQTLEPVYFWTLDFLRNDDPSGLNMQVSKIEEEFEASAGGGYYGELGNRASAMQDRAMAILQKVNVILKEILNLVYDLREYEVRLEAYSNADPKKQKDANKREGAEYSLKSIWMDQVDIKVGVGSINNLTRGDLQFITLRDAFMQANSEKDINRFDLNKRVKILLKKKITEYLAWREYSEKELRKRYSLEKNYLKSQIDSLKLYTKWAKPYLRAAQKLGMKEFGKGLPNPDIVAAFNNMQMELSLFAKTEIKPGSIYSEYQNKEFEKKYYSCLQIDFMYRTAPQTAQAGQSTHYAHVGTIDVWFTAYVLTEEELDKIEMQEVYEDMGLVENLTDVSLKDLQADLEHFLGDEEEGESWEKEEKGKFPNPFLGFSELIKPIGNIFMRKATTYQEERVKKAAREDVTGKCLALYDIFKKAHRMITW